MVLMSDPFRRVVVATFWDLLGSNSSMSVCDFDSLWNIACLVGGLEPPRSYTSFARCVRPRPASSGGRLEGGRPIPAVFDLFAVSNHMGVIGNGHYTALVRDWDGDGMSKNWYACDDDHCQPVSEDRVKTSNAYVLFYRRRPPCSR